MSLLNEFERRVDGLMRQFFGDKNTGAQGREAIEIQRMVLDAVLQRVQALPRARRVFPFNAVAVRIPVADAERRAAFEMVFAADGALQQEIVEQFRREEIEYPANLRVTVTLWETADVHDPSVVCTKAEAPAAAEPVPKAMPAVRLDPPGGEWRKARIHVGRLADVLDERRRLVRRNDVILDHGTVSRAHAHIEWHEDERAYRLFDDNSSYGTSVIHEGRLVDVPQAGGRGMRLEDGDEIYFGQVRTRFELGQ